MAALHGVSIFILCALIALTRSTVLELRFGNTTHLHGYNAFQELGSVMEVYCSAPHDSNSTMLSFVFGSSKTRYTAITTPEHVSVADKLTAKFTWQFSDKIDHAMWICCEVQNPIEETSTRGRSFTIFVSKVPSLAQSPVKNCAVNMTWTDARSGQAAVECNLQRSSHTRMFTDVIYTLYLVNSSGDEAEDTFLWSYVDIHPTNGNNPPAILEFLINSSIVARTDSVLLKIVFFERLSDRNITVLQRLNLLDSLVLPPDTLVWQPFSNSSGFIVTIHPGLLNSMCGSRTYIAELNMSSATDDKHKAQGFTIRCNPCVDDTSRCSATVGGLAPAHQYSVALRQRLRNAADAELYHEEMLQHVQETSLLTEEQAPLVGPELHPFYQVLDCDRASAACRSSKSCARMLKGGACQVVRIFWKAIPKNLSNGKISFYSLRIVKHWRDLTEDTVNVTGQVKTADIYRHPSQKLSISIAGGTSKGLPPMILWSTMEIPSQDEEQANMFPRYIMLSRRSAVEGPCNVSWFTEASTTASVAAQNATLLHCPTEATTCQEYTFWPIRAELTANGGWLPLERFLWSSDQQGAGYDFLCRDGTLALATTSPANAEPWLRKLEAVDCRITTENDVNSATTEITQSDAYSEGMCLKWLPPFPVACDTAPGRVVLLNLSLFSRDRERVLEQQVLGGSTTGHCFSRDKVEDAETYYASLTWAADIGLPEPYFIGPAEVMLKAPGLTVAAKSGVALAGVVCMALIVIGLVGCARKARAYQKTWRANLTIPKIKITKADQDGGPTLVHNNAAEKDQKCEYHEISRALADQSTGLLRKWYSKDSAFASQDSSSPPVDNDQSRSSLTDGHLKEVESGADVPCEVYTALGGHRNADLTADPCDGLACHVRTKPQQGQRLHCEDRGIATHSLSDDASPLLLVCVSDCAERLHKAQVPDRFEEGCISNNKFPAGNPNQFCGSALNRHGLPRSSGTATWACHYADQLLQEPRDDISVASYAFATVDTPYSVSSDSVSASDPQTCGSDLGPRFHCLECEDSVSTSTMDYITVSDAIKMTSA